MENLVVNLADVTTQETLEATSIVETPMETSFETSVNPQLAEEGNQTTLPLNEASAFNNDEESSPNEEDDSNVAVENDNVVSFAADEDEVNEDASEYLLNPVDQIKNTLNLFHPGEAFEIMALDSNRERCCFNVFTDVEKALPVLMEKNNEGFNIFMNLNPIKVWDGVTPYINKSMLYPASATRRAANSGDVEKMAFFAVDIDPLRVGQTKVCSATEEELLDALNVANKIKKYTNTVLGFPKPFKACSGNGWHLVWKIDLPANKQSERLVKNCLLALANKFNTDKALVDTSLHTSFHLIKLYGTVACKGKDTEERPWRLSFAKKFPETMPILTKQQLKDLASQAPTDRETVKMLSSSTNSSERSSYYSKKEKEKSEAEKFFKQFLTNAISFLGEDDNEAYVMLAPKGDRQRVFKIESTDFTDILQYSYHEETGMYMPKMGFEDSIDMLLINTRIAGIKKKIYTRIAQVGQAIYINMANAQKEVIKINCCDIRVLKQKDLSFNDPAFIVTKTMKPQITPNLSVTRTFEEIVAPYFNSICEPHRILFIVTLISWFWINQPRAIIMLSGAAGTGKSTVTKLIQDLIDPTSLQCGDLPNTKRDLAICLSKAYFSAFDNISNISKGISDTLCRAINVGSITQRKLCTDGDTFTAAFSSALLLNGIGCFCTHQDLLHRSLYIKTKTISQTERICEKELKEKLAKDLPDMLGAMYKIVQKTLEVAPSIRSNEKPRMADFFILGLAISKAIWGDSEIFRQAYMENIKDAFEDFIEENVLASAIRDYVDSWADDVTFVKKLPEQLYNDLCRTLDANNVSIATSKFPGSASALSKGLADVETALSSIGITFTRNPKSNGKRSITVSRNYTPQNKTTVKKVRSAEHKQNINLLLDDDEE